MADEKVLKVRGKFQTASAGDQKAGIGFTVDREHEKISLSVAERFLCERNVEVSIRVQNQEDIEGQLSFTDTSIHLEAVGTTTGFSVKTDKISSRLEFDVEDVDLKALQEFSGRWGAMEITVIKPE